MTISELIEHLQQISTKDMHGKENKDMKVVIDLGDYKFPYILRPEDVYEEYRTANECLLVIDATAKGETDE